VKRGDASRFKWGNLTHTAR